MLGPDALAWRDRHYGQSSCPQGRRRARENRGNRRNAAAPTPLFSRSQSDRAVLRKTHSSPAQVLRALHPRPLGSNRNNPPGLHSIRVQQLLHTRRIWAKMRGIRSRAIPRQARQTTDANRSAAVAESARAPLGGLTRLVLSVRKRAMFVR